MRSTFIYWGKTNRYTVRAENFLTVHRIFPITSQLYVTVPMQQSAFCATAPPSSIFTAPPGPFYPTGEEFCQEPPGKIHGLVWHRCARWLQYGNAMW